MEIQKGAVLLVRICNAFPHVSPLYVCISVCTSYLGRSTHTLLLQGARAPFCSALSSPLTALSSHGVSGQHISSISQISAAVGLGCAAFGGAAAGQESAARAICSLAAGHAPGTGAALARCHANSPALGFRWGILATLQKGY